MCVVVFVFVCLCVIYCVVPTGVLLCVWLLSLCAVCLNVFVSFVCDALCDVVWYLFSCVCCFVTVCGL